MGYVLVPVPTEYVLDVMRWVLFRTVDDDDGDDRSNQDGERVAQLVSEVDDATRSLLRIVATATVKDEPLRLRDLADELGREAEDVRATLRSLNKQVLEGGRALMELRNETAVGVHGQTGTFAYVSMRPDLAGIVRSAATTTGDAAQ